MPLPYNNPGEAKPLLGMGTWGSNSKVERLTNFSPYPQMDITAVSGLFGVLVCRSANGGGEVGNFSPFCEVTAQK